MSLLQVSTEDAPSDRKAAAEALKKQREAKRKKEELLLKHKLEKSTESCIDALCHHDMCNSLACWSTEEDMVDEGVKKIKSKAAQLNAAKENVRMRVLGLGFSDLAHPWSKDGVVHSVDELCNHLKHTIGEEGRRTKLNKPPPMMPKRKDMLTLGAAAPDLAAVDKKQQDNTGSFEENAKRVREEREEAGAGDRCGLMQPEVNNKLIGQRLDVCFCCDLIDEEGSELRWCQRSTTEVSNGSNMNKTGRRSGKSKAGEAVMIRWDKNDLTGEPESESPQLLLASKWNPQKKHKERCWRMDVRVANGN